MCRPVRVSWGRAKPGLVRRRAWLQVVLEFGWSWVDGQEAAQLKMEFDSLYAFWSRVRVYLKTDRPRTAVPHQRPCWLKLPPLQSTPPVWVRIKKEGFCVEEKEGV